MAAKDTITLKVDVDAKSAASGLRPLNAALDQTRKAADATEAELDKIGSDTAKIRINDDAIDAARKEITRLRTQIRDDLRVNIDADTRPSLKRIGELKRTIKSLDDEPVHIEADVDVDTVNVSRFGQVLLTVENELSNIGGVIPGIGLLNQGLGLVGVSSAAAATGVGVFAVALGVAAKQAWDLGRAAADVETSVTQMEALTGGTGLGAGFFADLQEWAAETPFAIDDAADAAKRLLAAGVPLAEVNDNLNDMGNIASATGVPISQIATVFAQMESSGRASYEDLKQFADAGIPVWQVLSEKLGLSVQEVQKLASEGKLGADSIDLVRESLNNMFPSAMSDQAETFNGLLSTMQDNLNQTGQALGVVFLPAMTDLISTFNTALAPILRGAQAIGQFNAEVEGIGPGLGFVNLIPAGFALDLLNGGLKDADKSTKGLTTDTAALEAQVTASLDNSTAEVVDFNKALEDTIDAFGKIGTGRRTRIDFIFGEVDVEAELRKLTHGKEAVELPAELTLKRIGGLGDKQQQIVETISGSVEASLEEGARRASLNPNFDSAAWYRQVRAKTKDQLISVGVNPGRAERLLRTVFGLPRTVPVEADISPAQRELHRWHPPAKTVLVKPKVLVDRPGANKPSTLALLDQGGSLPSTVAPVAAEVSAGSISTANQALKSVASPGGDGRVAPINPKVSATSLRNVDAKLDKLTKDRHLTIYVHAVKVGAAATTGAGAVVIGGVSAPTAETRTGLVATGRALSAATTSTLPSPSGYAIGTQASATRAPGGAPAAPVRLRPRETPVAVYLDGAQIADRLDLRRSLVATESIRRTP